MPLSKNDDLNSGMGKASGWNSKNDHIRNKAKSEESGAEAKGISPPSISLPKGGGAIKGIGEKFQMNPVTGTGSMSVPIATSPSRSDFFPKLAINYDSGAGNGIFGLGWNLSIPSITRKTDKGLPKYLDADESDTYILSEAEDLVPALKKIAEDKWEPDIIDDKDINPEYKIYRYRPRIDGLFARIERWENKETRRVHWKSISKDNITSIYGKTAEKVKQSDGTEKDGSNSRIYDPEDENKVFQWLLEESYDDKGNTILYKYISENNDGVTHKVPYDKNRKDKPYANLYIKRILYGNKTPRQDEIHPDDDFMFEVVFDYGEHDDSRPLPNDYMNNNWHIRSDCFSNYRAGFEIRTQRLCHRVLMFHHFADELQTSPCLVRSTDFIYDQHKVVTYLTSAKQTGYLWDKEKYASKSLPPLEFIYHKVEINEDIQVLDPESMENLPIGIDNSSYQFVDLDGEGLSGILTEQGDGWFYKQNWGGLPKDYSNRSDALPPDPPDWHIDDTVHFSPTRRVVKTPSLGQLHSGRAQILDLAGDGQCDLVLLDKPVSGFFERTDDQEWTTFKSFSSQPNINWKDPNLKMIDLNGDGHADVLITEHDVFTWYPSEAENGFGESRYVRKSHDEEQGPTLVFSDGTQSIYLADMCGDGLNDIVRIRNGEICYWPNIGYGHFGAKVTMDNPPTFEPREQFNQNRIRLADIDGSGTNDILYLYHDHISIWLNQSGNSWQEKIVLKNIPYIDNLSSVMVADLLGKGTACIVWSSPLPANGAQPMMYIDLMKENKPHLMYRTLNNMGAETELIYAPSTKYYIDDLKHSSPWITRLPFPVHVVEKVITRELVTKSTFVSVYKYHHGYFDGQDREFRGFGMVEQWDTESYIHFHDDGQGEAKGQADEEEFHQPPVYTKTWFHTGCYLDREHISRQYEKEYYKGDADAWLLPDTILPLNDLTTNEEHEACRALKGRVLRQEIYAADDSPERAHPYQVTESNYTLRLVQPMQDLRHAVFFAHERETINYYYERNPRDPRISHSLTIKVDDFGNVKKSVAIGYPRRPSNDPNVTHPSEQKRTIVILTENEFFNQDDAKSDWYRAGVPFETKSYELTGPLFQDVTEKVTINDIEEYFEDPVSHHSPTEIPYEAIPNHDTRQIRCVEHSRTIYYNDDLSEPLELGNVAARAIPYENYTLVFTPGLLQHIFGDKIDEKLLKNEGQYRKGADLIERGYFHEFDNDTLWWIPSGIQIFDPAQFCLPVKVIDPFQAETTIEYDVYSLLPIRTTDHFKNSVTADIDYRTMQPCLLIDPNANQSAVKFDELGMVVATALMGKNGEGDTLDDPTTKLEYELLNWWNKPEEERSPNYVHTFAREKHGAANPRWQESYTYTDGLGREVMTKIQAEPGLAWTRDEAGNLIQVDTSPEVRWVGTGRTIVNNKGNPIKQYEPFFHVAHEFVDETDLVEWGVTPIMRYDALGRLIRTDNPNGTFSKVVFDAWYQETWDENDTVLESDWFNYLLPSYDPKTRILPNDASSQQVAAYGAAKHANTPTTEHLDVLARPFKTVALNTEIKTDRRFPDIVAYETHIQLDTEGKPLLITDARGNKVMAYYVEYEDENQKIIEVPAYDVTGNLLYQNSMDAGKRWMLNNVAGHPIRSWDNRDHELSYEYDELQRPKQSIVRGGDGDSVLDHVFEKIEYGDKFGMSDEEREQSQTRNCIGAVTQQYDGAGIVTNELYDFKGNLLKSSRQLAKQYKKTLNWAVGQDMENEIFISQTTYDALNRPIQLVTPHTDDIPPNIIQPVYNEANLLNSVDVWLRKAELINNLPERLLEPDTADLHPVTDINYNEKGQRDKIVYGNGAQTDYVYERETFRLINLYTIREKDPSDLQSLFYTYDPVGNITEIRDEAQQTIYFDNGVVAPHAHYEYDALYQLILADGREHMGQVAPPARTYDWNDAPRRNPPNPRDCTKMTRYTQQYIYDQVGNILNMIHREGAIPLNDGATLGAVQWNRWYQYATQSNRLMSTSFENEGDPDKYYSDDFEYTAKYEPDLHGNMETMHHLSVMEWNFKDQLKATATQVVKNGGISETTYYVYDAAGQRVRKVTDNYLPPGGEEATRKNERLYIGGFEIYREYNGNGSEPILERETLHIMDDQQRIALVETKTVKDGDDITKPVCLKRYQFGNHLGSASLELDEGAGVISYEEFYPYGNTSYQAGRSVTEVSSKRYGYTGKERDYETGLYYYGARYCVAWLGRWCSCDPIGIKNNLNIFMFSLNNPIFFTDKNGKQEKGSVLLFGLFRANLNGIEVGYVDDIFETAMKLYPEKELSFIFDAKNFPDFNDIWDIKHTFTSGYFAQLGLEGARGITDIHFDLRGIEDVVKKTSAGVEMTHTSSELGNIINFLSSGDKPNVNIHFLSEEGLSTIKKGSSVVEGIPLPQFIREKLPPKSFPDISSFSKAIKSVSKASNEGAKGKMKSSINLGEKASKATTKSIPQMAKTFKTAAFAAGIALEVLNLVLGAIEIEEAISELNKLSTLEKKKGVSQTTIKSLKLEQEVNIYWTISEMLGITSPLLRMMANESLKNVKKPEDLWIFHNVPFPFDLSLWGI